MQIYAITLVYNLRVSETTKRQVDIFGNKKGESIFTAIGFNQYRYREDGTHQFAGGLLATYVYVLDHFYARVIAGGGHIASHSDASCFEQNQMDDILFSAGFETDINDCAHTTISFHLGLPVHNDNSLNVYQLGIGHVGIGMQIDGTWQYAESSALFGAMRLIHFLPRRVTFLLVEPPPFKFKFNLGNIADLFIANQSHWGPHQLNVGYNPTFIFDASLKPYVPRVLNVVQDITQSFFVSYRYSFYMGETPSAIVFGFSYGFAHRPEHMSDKSIWTPWISWGILF